MGSFFGEDTLKKVLGNDGYKELKEVAIDKGQAFLSNQITSSFVNVGKTKEATTAMYAATTAIGAYKTGEAIASTFADSEARKEMQNTLQSMAVSIVAEGTTIMTQETAKHITLYTMRHAEAIKDMPKQILNYATAYFNANKLSVGDIIKELKNHNDETGEKQFDDMLERSQEQYKTDKKAKRDKIISDVMTYTSKVSSTLNQITDYMNEGPQWIIDRMDHEIKGVSQYVEKKLDTQWREYDKPAYDDYARRIGEAKGKNMAEAYNRLLKNAQQKIMAKAEAQISKGKTKVKSALTIKILGIAAKTGVL